MMPRTPVGLRQSLPDGGLAEPVAVARQPIIHAPDEPAGVDVIELREEAVIFLLNVGERAAGTERCHPLVEHGGQRVAARRQYPAELLRTRQSHRRDQFGKIAAVDGDDGRVGDGAIELAQPHAAQQLLGGRALDRGPVGRAISFLLEVVQQLGVAAVRDHLDPYLRQLPQILRLRPVAPAHHLLDDLLVGRTESEPAPPVAGDRQARRGEIAFPAGDRFQNVADRILEDILGLDTEPGRKSLGQFVFRPVGLVVAPDVPGRRRVACEHHQSPGRLDRFQRACNRFLRRGRFLVRAEQPDYDRRGEHAA